MKIARLGGKALVERDSPRPALADLGWTLAGGGLLAGLVGLAQLVPALAPYLVSLRLPLGLAYLLFAPGYLLQAALFPRRDDLDGVERLGLSLGLSVALIPLLALVLDNLPWGLRLGPVVIGQALLLLLLFLASVTRRRLLPAEAVYAPDLRPRPGAWWRGLASGERRLLLFAAVALLFAGLAAGWVFLVPSGAEFMTEFYMLGPGGLAEDLPRQASPGEALSLTLGVTNRERAAGEYRLEIWQVDTWNQDRRQLVGSGDPFTLQPGETRQWQQAWEVQWAGQDQQFAFFLYHNDDLQPYRRLLLWMDVQP